MIKFEASENIQATKTPNLTLSVENCCDNKPCNEPYILSVNPQSAVEYEIDLTFDSECKNDSESESLEGLCL